MIPEHHREALAVLARRAVEHAAEHRQPLPCASEDHADFLLEPRGCFVTLERDGLLRGCVGSLVPRGSLWEELVAAALGAALRDPRFPPLSGPELTDLTIHVSVLSRPRPLSFADEEDLLAKLAPLRPGVILRDGLRMGTFLPQVWDKLPEPRQFLRQLKMKAGLEPDTVSPGMEIELYEAEVFEA